MYLVLAVGVVVLPVEQQQQEGPPGCGSVTEEFRTIVLTMESAEDPKTPFG
jgi:hypothetical protein